MALLAMAFLSAGCAGFSSVEVDGAGGADAGGENAGAPRVVSISPADGATGIWAQAPIVVTFSEPVDLASARAAVSVSGLSSDDLDLRADASGTTLTLRPKDGFAYASGTDPAATRANCYTVNVGAELVDLDGTPLAAPFTSTFSTLRRISQDIADTASGDYYTYAVAFDHTVNRCSDASSTFEVGHTSSIAASGDHHGIAAFESALPEGAVEVESAWLTAHQAPPRGSFYDAGSVELEQIAFQAFDVTLEDAPALTDFATFSASGDVARPRHDVTTAVADGVASGTRSFMYRLSAVGGPDNAYARFYCDAFTLDVTYLAP
jgi:hypothetical protein